MTIFWAKRALIQVKTTVFSHCFGRENHFSQFRVEFWGLKANFDDFITNLCKKYINLDVFASKMVRKRRKLLFFSYFLGSKNHLLAILVKIYPFFSPEGDF